MLLRLLGLLMFLAGVGVVMGLRLKAAERPGYGLREWFRPDWSEPRCNRKPLFWIGQFLWVAGIVLVFVKF